MSERIQLNLRLDKCPELYEIIKTEAKKQGSSINDFAINLLRQGVGLEIEKRPISEIWKRVVRLEQRVEEIEKS
jgi:hypothetical protein